MGSKNLSLSCELEAARFAVEGAAHLAENILNDEFGTEAARQAAPRTLRSTLALVAARLARLQRCVAGQADPAELADAWNTAQKDSPEDLVLPAWKEHRRHQERQPGAGRRAKR